MEFKDIKSFCKYNVKGISKEMVLKEQCANKLRRGSSIKLATCEEGSCPFLNKKIEINEAIQWLEEERKGYYATPLSENENTDDKKLIEVYSFVIDYLKRWKHLSEEIYSYIIAISQNGEKFEWGDKISYNPSEIKEILKNFFENE